MCVCRVCQATPCPCGEYRLCANHQEWTTAQGLKFLIGSLAGVLGLLAWIAYQPTGNLLLWGLGVAGFSAALLLIDSSRLMAPDMPNCTACNDAQTRPHVATRKLNKLFWCREAMATLEARVKAKTGAGKFNIKQALWRVGEEGNSAH